MFLLFVGIIRDLLKNGKNNSIKAVLKDINYFTIGLLAGLFVVIGGITEAGLVDKIAEVFLGFAGDNIFVIYTLIV